ncbi:MAG: type II secretion system F family protein [bacterium]
MKKYYWTGIDLSGKSLFGVKTASNSQELGKLLLDSGVAILSFKEKQNQNFFINMFFLNRKISLKQKFLFFEQLYLLVESGIELLKALQIVLVQIKNKKFKKVLYKIIDDIKEGKNLSISMQECDGVFDSYVINLIAAGESSGRLAFVFKDIAKNFEQRLSVINKIKHASLLPFITLAFALIIVLGIFVFVIPQFEQFFTSFGKELPNTTQLVFGISRFLRSNDFLPYFLFFLFSLVFIKFIFYLPAVKWIKDKLVFKIYFIGRIFLDYDLIVFLQTLSMFLLSGVDMQKSLDFSQTTVKNTYFKDKLKTIKTLVFRGKSLKESIQMVAPDYFGQDIIGLIEVGEQTGNLGKMLERSLIICKKSLDRKLRILTTIFQPILLIFVGLIIVFLMLSVYLPIFSMAGIL